jgi:hypothetical protein
MAVVALRRDNYALLDFLSSPTALLSALEQFLWLELA